LSLFRRGKAARPRDLDAAEGYALWAAQYPRRPDNGLMSVEQRAVLRLLPELEGRAVLDLACGSGRYLAAVRARGAALAVGLDLVEEMLLRARQVSPLLIRADLGHLPVRDGAFDVIVCGLAVGHQPDLRAALGEIARVLGPGGVLVYSDMHPEGARAGWRRTFQSADGRILAIRHHAHELRDHRAACAAAGLELEELREPAVEVEGPWQGCPAAVVVRARKGQGQA
jgi:malonyl-CoA O-methyltransferase